MRLAQGLRTDSLLWPLHQWVWGDFDRRVRKLLAFAEVETDGGRDILRAAEVTPDPLLRRLYLEHAIDELHHGDPITRAICEEILRDEVFHMNYTYTQLARVSPSSYRRHVWRARTSRLWKRYVRAAAAVGDLIGTAVLTAMYFTVLPTFAWLARRAERREPLGWTPISRNGGDSPTSQY